MKHIIKTVMVALVVLVTISCKEEQKQTEENTTATDTVAKTEHRIVSLNGALTEIVSALGHQDEIVGVDVTSTYPEKLKESAQRFRAYKQNIS